MGVYVCSRDGIGACVKCAARAVELQKEPTYLRLPIDMFRWARRHFNDDKKWPAPSAGAEKHTVSKFLCWFVEHEDDPEGTAGSYTQAERPFVLPAVPRSNLREVDTLSGSCTRSSYCFDSVGATATEGQLAVRWLPCGCRKCCVFQSNQCELKGQVGVFGIQTQRVKSAAGLRVMYQYRRAETEKIATGLKVDDFIAVAPCRDNDDDFWIAQVMQPGPHYARARVKGLHLVVETLVRIVISIVGVGTDDQEEIREGDWIIPIRWFNNNGRDRSTYSVEREEVVMIHVQSVRCATKLEAIRRATSNHRPTLYHNLSQEERERIVLALHSFESADSYEL